MSWDLHLANDIPDASDPVPYQCTTCGRIGMSRRRRPQCCGTSCDGHAPADMRRADERDIRPGDVEELVLR
jgi:hypothetical protein